MDEALERIGVAVAIGLLIGLERERAEARKARRLFAGVRTFPLIALTGAIPVLLRDVGGAALVVASFAAIVIVATVSYARSSAAGAPGATTEIAAIGTFLLGALAGAGRLEVAGATGVAVAVLLAAKPRLEAFSRAITTDELAAALELAVITVIVLPLLPDRGFGPWGALNPREIWLVVILVSGLSFAGFVLIRVLGEHRGLTLTGALGGLVSSTAVTLAMAEHSRGARGTPRTAAAATVVASTIMCARIGVEAGVVDPGVLPPLLPVLGAMGVAGAVAAWLLLRGPHRAPPPGTRLTNPFRLRAALAFAGIYGTVVLVVRGAEDLLGYRGLWAAAAVAGFADVDAPTVAFARLARDPAVAHDAAVAIAIAAIANTTTKLALAVGLGAGRFRWQAGSALAAMSLVGVLAGVALTVAQ